MARPCSVKAYGVAETFIFITDAVTNCDRINSHSVELKIENL